MEYVEKSSKIKDRVLHLIDSHELLPNDLVQICEAISESLKLKTISEIAKSEKLSYNGAKLRAKNMKFVKISWIKLYIND